MAEHDRSKPISPLEPVALKRWRIEEVRVVARFPIFEISERPSVSAMSGRAHPFYVMDSAEWVNIIPVTPEGEVVLVRQWRHGLQQFTLEIPGGLVDPGESPRTSAIRELLEETGYTSEEVELLGVISPNPAIQSNFCHTFIARNARQVATPNPEGTEEIEVVTLPVSTLRALARAGQIQHALVMVALYWWELKYPAEGRED
ncbi:MAG: NUDIX hydrolase [Myxococcota bacterium]